MSENSSKNLRNGLTDLNGMRLGDGFKDTAGLSLAGGLNAQAGLSPTSALMNNEHSRTFVSYVVRCALPEGRSLVKTDKAGIKYTFAGALGFAPEWEAGKCEQGCQEWTSACMLSLINTTGVHVPLLVMADRSGVGFGQSSEYPRQEGSFFGNIFGNDFEAHYCAGRDYKVGPVAGRIGSSGAATLYTNMYGTGGTCAQRCTPADNPHAADGYKACSGWNRVVTIWRK